MAESTILATIAVIAFLSSVVIFMTALKIQRQWVEYSNGLLKFCEKMNKDWADACVELNNSWIERRVKK